MKSSTILFFSVLASLILFHVTGRAQTDWVWSNPFPQGDPLYKVSFVGRTTGFAVGVNGAIVRTTDAGSHWTSVVSPTTMTLLGVWFSDSVCGTVVGGTGSMFRTTDGGQTWIAQSGNTTNSISSVCFFDSKIGSAVGDQGLILRTTNGGVTWERQSSIAWQTLRGVWLTDANHGTIVGGGKILFTKDGGNTWMNQESPVSISLNSVCFTDTNNGIVVGANGVVVRTTNSGGSWTVQPTGTTEEFYCVSFADSLNGIAGGHGGVLIRSTDAGETWFMLTSPTTDDIYGVSATGPHSATIVGDHGRIYETKDGGFTWDLQEVGTRSDLNSVSFTDAYNGMAVGMEGRIVHTTDGGASWVIQSNPAGRPLFAVSVVDENFATAVGDFGSIVGTSDGGETWTTQEYGILTAYSGVSRVDPDYGFAVGWDGSVHKTTDGGEHWIWEARPTANFLMSVSFCDRMNGIAVGCDQTIVHTTDGGASWETQTSPVATCFQSVSMTDPRTATAAGSGGKIARTTDGGATWTLQSSPAGSDDLSSISFCDREHGVATGGGGGYQKIVITTDGGSSWYLQSSPTKFALYGISMTDSVTATACGNSGTILRRRLGGPNEGISTPRILAPRYGSGARPTSDTLRWSRAIGANAYELQLSQDSSFASKTIHDSLLTDTTRLVSGLSNGARYFWRIRGRNQHHSGRYSIPYRFETIVAVPAQVQLSLPQNGTGIGTDLVTFAWRPGSPAIEGYELTVVGDSTLVMTTTDTMMTLIIPAAGEQKPYVWKVRAKNPAGFGPFSAIWTFDRLTTTLASKPLYPANGDTLGVYTSNQKVVFRWAKSVDPDSCDSLLYGIHIRGPVIGLYKGIDVSTTDTSMTFSNIMVDLVPDTTYRWWITTWDGHVMVTSDTAWFRTSDTLLAVKGEPDLPHEYALYQNYPNPFNLSTTIRYDLPKESHVVLKVYNVLGQEVAQIVDFDQRPGRYARVLDGSKLASGIYFYRLQAGEFVATKSLILLK